MSHTRNCLALAALAMLAVARVGRAAEPWADPKLPVTSGLELWLDATRPGSGKPADGPLAVWADGSGKKRDVRQTVKGAQPRRVVVGDAGVVRFDGIDDVLRYVGRPEAVPGFTLFGIVAPRANPGGFLGFLSFNAAGQRDYTSGLNLDMGSAPSPRFAAVNVEGRGFQGERSLPIAGGKFGRLYTLEATGDPSAKTVRLVADGKPAGSRPWTGAAVGIDEVTIGARFPDAGPGPQVVRGFASVDVAEVLLYNRPLTASEATAVRAYLAAKYDAIRDALPPAGDGRGEPLVQVADPPPVQVLVPGFEVRELPVKLPNINNVRCRPDGTVIALGYDGTIYRLRDTDGDGVEDKAEVFWKNTGSLRAPIGMALTPPGYKHGDGVFVAAKGRCTLIVDTDGDGVADKEIVVAGGWTEIVNNVDALGVAIDPKDGSVYFGRVCADYTNAYLTDKAGNARYSLSDESGTIQRVTPDFKTRETVATGIRVPVAMGFNRHGDLFATDQEGATWLANGNPFDELLQIQKGRHYGFPPRHPKHLPGVIDEPSVFDYGPQHQSTCGLVFNEPAKPGGPTFGPKEWAGDALVTGYSRGKLYRTQLVKTASGYVARTHLFACLSQLTIDTCVTADGGLLVACHGGGPDWGSGPKGDGRLFKIRYTGRDLPQPTLVWAVGPREVRVEFDRPVEPALLKDVAVGAKLTAGKFVRAGDRFETVWPGYAVVGMEKSTPRYPVPVRSAQLTPDRRTLVLATDALPAAVHYALTIPGLGRPTTTAKGAIAQHPQADLDFDLSGCTASWTPKDGGPVWDGWLPYFDLPVARELTVGSAHHDALWAAIQKPGTLTLKAKLNLTDMLRPAVQPGARIDYELPPETVTIGADSSGSITISTPAAKPSHMYYDGPQSSGTFTLQPKRGEPVPVEVRIAIAHPNPRPDPSFRIWYSTAEDKRWRALPLHRSLVPWAVTDLDAFDKPAASPLPAELAGGSWARGRKVFLDAEVGCAKCHAAHGLGGDIGPDLTNLIYRDYQSVHRDVTKPSFAINPDYVTSVVTLADGRVLTGVARTAGDQITVADQTGVKTTVPRSAVEGVKLSTVSTMPEGLLDKLGPDRTRDLFTYLLAPPPAMPRDYKGQRPKPRAIAEVNAVLAGAPTPPAKTRPIRVVLVAGPKDHGPGEHDYPAWQKAWKDLLAAADGVDVATAWEWPAKEEFAKADAMVFYQRGDWTAARAADIDAFLDRGGGLVYVHWAVDGRGNGPEFAKRIGLAGHGGKVGFRHGPIDLSFNRTANHPVTRNFDRLTLVDETYWDMTGDLPADRVMATGVEVGKTWPQVWSLEQGKGRVFVSIPGHYSWTFDDPLFRVLLLRGIAWTAKEPVDRFNDLVWPGAEVVK